MTGRLIAVVGPSGVGKDSVLRGLVAARPGLGRVRRVITRPPDDATEDFDAVDDAEFARRAAAGDFALHWHAHGLHYGIPARLHDDLAAGRDMAVNMSRGVLDQAARGFPDLMILRLSASPAVLAARLALRGRESAADIAGRLARDGAPVPPGVPVVDLHNDGLLDDTVARALAALYPPVSG